MSWNYRVVRRVLPASRSGEEPFVDFGLHEVHTNQRGEPYAWSAEPRPLHAESLEELHDTFVRACAALGAGVLEHDMKLGKAPDLLDEEEAAARAARRRRKPTSKARAASGAAKAKGAPATRATKAAGRRGRRGS